MKAEIPNEAGTMLTQDRMNDYFAAIRAQAKEQAKPGPSLLMTPQSQNTQVPTSSKKKKVHWADEVDNQEIVDDQFNTPKKQNILKAGSHSQPE